MIESNLRFDLEALLSVFDELMPLTNEEQQDYWFQKTREDGVIIILNFSVYENQVGIIVRGSAKVSFASVNFHSCTEIKVLEKQCLEVLAGEDGEKRCFLSLIGSSILEVTS